MSWAQLSFHRVEPAYCIPTMSSSSRNRRSFMYDFLSDKELYEELYKRGYYTEAPTPNYSVGFRNQLKQHLYKLIAEQTTTGTAASMLSTTKTAIMEKVRRTTETFRNIPLRQNQNHNSSVAHLKPSSQLLVPYDTGSDSEGDTSSIPSTSKTSDRVVNRTKKRNASSSSAATSRIKFDSDLYDPRFRYKKMYKSDFHERSNIISMCILSTFIAFFAYLAYCYMGIKSTSENLEEKFGGKSTDFPNCFGNRNQIPGIHCVSSDEMQETIESAKILYPHLKAQVTHHFCSHETLYISNEDITEMLIKAGLTNVDIILPNLRVFILRNKHWGFHIVEKGIELADVSSPWHCIIKNIFFYIMGYVMIILPVVFGIFSLLVMIKYLSYRNNLFNIQKNLLKARIMDSLEYHAHCTEDGTAKVPIQTIRKDILKTGEFDKELDAAINELVLKDNKIRVHTVIREGEETSLFLSINLGTNGNQNDVPFHDDFRFDTVPPLITQAGLEQDDVSTQEESDEQSNNILGLTPYIKIKNMFATKPIDENCHDTSHIIEAILERCGNCAAIINIIIEENGIIYMNCSSTHDSGLAFKALHGGWYSGRLITCKFISYKRYQQKFINASRYCYTRATGCYY